VTEYNNQQQISSSFLYLSFLLSNVELVVGKVVGHTGGQTIDEVDVVSLFVSQGVVESAVRLSDGQLVWLFVREVVVELAVGLVVGWVIGQSLVVGFVVGQPSV
jgi:hypothetical protein